MNPRVLDTSIVSLMMAGSDILTPYRPLMEESRLIVSFQTVAELRFGALKAQWGLRRREALQQVLASFDIIGYTDDLASRWAETMYDSRAAGRRLEVADAWIAATAKHLNAPLLTHDRDFDVGACPSITVYCFAN